MRPKRMLRPFWMATWAIALAAGCATSSLEPGGSTEGQNVCILEGPVAVMPVVYRPRTYISEDVEKRKKQVNILAAVARSLMARLLKAKSLEVIALPEIDNCIAEVMPGYWNEEGRAPEKLKLFAAKTGAKTILFLDVHERYSYKRATGLDYLSYQVAAPDIVGVPGYIEVYDYKGEPIQAFTAVAEIPAGTSIEALSRSVFCIAANYLFHTRVLPEQKSMAIPGQVVPFPQITAERALYTEAKATEALIGKILSACLATKVLGDLENQPLQVDQSLVKRSLYSIDMLEEPTGPIPAPKGSTIGILFAPHSDRPGKVIDLTPTGASKYIAFSQGWIKRIHQKIEKARIKYESQLLQELTKIGKAKGYTFADSKGEQVWHSGMFQDMSSSMLMEKARKLDCDILIFVKTKGPVDTKMTKFETSVKILEARSGKFRKDFFVFVLEPRQIAKRVLGSSFITPTEDHEK